MKKTLTANISGTVFHIEEDAYDQLNRYLANIRSKFSGSAGADEIISDIEARIAELFSERLVGRQVVTITDVEHVIAVMGQPEDYVGDEGGQGAGAGAGTGAAGAPSTGPRTRRLFRNPEDKWVGGVLGGMAAYFNTDPLWFRIAFILFVIFGVGSPILIYLILWILVPEASTPAERLMMEGEPVTVDNLKRAFEEGAERFKSGAETMAREAQEMGRRWNTPEARKRQREAASGVEAFFRSVFGAVGKVIGVFLLFLGTVLSLSLVTALITGGTITLDGLTNDHGLYELSGVLFDTPDQGFWAVCGAVLLFLVPAIGIFLGGLRLVADVQVPRWLGWTLSATWFGALVVVLVIGTSLFNDFKRTRLVREEVPLVQPAGQTMTLDLLRPGNDDKRWSVHYNDGRMDLDLDELIVNDSLLLGSISVDVEASPDSLYHLVAERRAHGMSAKVAVARAEHLRFIAQQTDSVVRVAPFLRVPLEDKFRAQRIRLVLQVPVGRGVHFTEAVGTVLYDVANVTNTLDRDMLGRTWTMTSGGLSGSVRPEQVPDDLLTPMAPQAPTAPPAPAPNDDDDRPQADLPNLFRGLDRLVRA